MARSAQVLRSALRNGSLRRVLAGFFLFNAQEYAVWIAVIVYAFEERRQRVSCSSSSSSRPR